MEGHVALVTGAARGIGAAVAKELLEKGCKVLLCDILTTQVFIKLGKVPKTP